MTVHHRTHLRDTLLAFRVDLEHTVLTDETELRLFGDDPAVLVVVSERGRGGVRWFATGIADVHALDAVPVIVVGAAILGSGALEVRRQPRPTGVEVARYEVEVVDDRVREIPLCRRTVLNRRA